MKSKLVINTAFHAAQPFITSAVDTIFMHGRSFANLFKDTPLCWLNADEIYLSPNYQQHYMWAGLTASYATALCPDG